MKRRKKNQPTTAGMATGRVKNQKSVSGRGKKDNFRFKVSLIFLSAALLISTILFLIAAINCTKRVVTKNQVPAAGMQAVINKAKDSMSFSKTGVVSGEDLDFEVTVPSQMGDWFFRSGFVKSPVDNELSDQYVQIYIPVSGKTDSKNIDDRYKNILTIKKFLSSEWEEIESGCQKKNLLYCEMAGTKIDEKGGHVYSFSQLENCPQNLAAKCQLAAKILETFKFK